jgi:hypothetical protein
MSAFASYGSRQRLYETLLASEPELTSVSWMGAGDDLPLKVRHALGSAQFNLRSLFGIKNTNRVSIEKPAEKSLAILREGPKPWSYIPDHGMIQWHEPLAVFLAQSLNPRDTAKVSPAILPVLLRLAHQEPGDTVAGLWHIGSDEPAVPVSLSALAVMAFEANLPRDLAQRQSFFGRFRQSMVYAAPEWWQPDALGVILAGLSYRSSMAAEVSCRLAVAKTLFDEGLPGDTAGVEDLAAARRSIDSYNGAEFLAIKEDMDTLHRELVKRRLDHISAPSSPKVRPPRL